MHLNKKFWNFKNEILSSLRKGINFFFIFKDIVMMKWNLCYILVWLEVRRVDKKVLNEKKRKS